MRSSRARIRASKGNYNSKLRNGHNGEDAIEDARLDERHLLKEDPTLLKLALSLISIGKGGRPSSIPIHRMAYRAIGYTRAVQGLGM